MEVIDLLYKIPFFMFRGNRDFFKIIDEFHDKLPPQHKRAKKSDLQFMTLVDTTNMKMSLTTAEIDLFHKKLENFNYNSIYFKRQAIREYSNNIQRLLSTSKWEKFGIECVQTLLEDDSFKHSKPYLFGYKTGKLIGY